MYICTYIEHEQSYYIVHYSRRKEEGKEGRKKPTNNNSLSLMYTYVHVHSEVSLKYTQDFMLF